MLFNRINLDAIPKPVFAHVYSCPGYTTKLNKKLPSIEIAYVKKGELKIEIMNKEFIAREGSFIVLPRNYEFNIHTSKNEAHIHYTISASTDSRIVLDEDSAIYEKDEIVVPLIIQKPQNHKNCEALLYEAIEEYQRANYLSSVKCGTIMARLLCELAENFDTPLKPTSEKTNILDDRIKKYIEKNISSKILLQDIGDALCKNANYLNQVFKKKNGVSIISYANLEKMKKAAVLIADKGYNIKDAAKEVGINDVNYFSRVFKQKMGMSVMQYKASSVDITFPLIQK